MEPCVVATRVRPEGFPVFPDAVFTVFPGVAGGCRFAPC
jgi:hypothetical protein